MRKDFFISYTADDSKWAEWVTYALENAGYSTVVQFLDFQAGVNFVGKIDDALGQADRVMLLLSPAFMKSGFTKAEWSAAFSLDPDGSAMSIVPVMVKEFEIRGLLAPRAYISLHGLPEEEAKRELLKGLRNPRDPDIRRTPQFPGKT